MNKLILNWAALLLASLMLAACAGQRDAATKAVGDIEASIASLRDDASKYAAAELQQAEAGLASLKDQLAKEDFKGVVAAAPAVSAQVASLQQTVAAKREEAHAAMAAASEEWRTLSAEVPQMVQAVQSRVDVLAQSKKLPKGVSKEAFESAQTGLEAAKTAWTEATAAFGAGDPVKAVELGKSAKESGTAALSSLGMG
jgi:DNA repair exonuclease SbcCD ATPase subunit